MPDTCFTDSTDAAISLSTITKSDFDNWLIGLDEGAQEWVGSSNFKAKPGTLCLLPSTGGTISQAVVGMPAEDSITLWDWAAVAKILPPGTYNLAEQLDEDAVAACLLGWALSNYSFDRYQQENDDDAAPEVDRILVWQGINETTKARAVSAARAISLVRNLVNTPANHMGPEELAAAAVDLAGIHDAHCAIISGEDLLEAGYPAIHAVGRASDRDPCLIDLTWGDASHPKITLVGKGVCFDTGGLDLKNAGGMKMMKKDMGGSAQALGLASMIMDAELPVRLRVLIPAVENAVSGNAMRPLDVVDTRKGLTIEIGNTDAEGRVVLSDALYEACTEQPELIVDFATLTGAARVALGAELPALFCNNNKIARDVIDCGTALNDPMWQMPLWQGYKKMVDGKVADLNNAPEGGMGGAITAALFLERFVSDDDGNVPDWMHIDLMAWNQSSRPGRPEGGEAMSIRALFAYLEKRFDR